MAVGTGLGIVFFVGSLYVLTRPCVIGECPIVLHSQQFDKTAFTSNQDLLSVYEQLNQTIERLQTIPGWSPYHDRAEQLLFDYLKQAESLSNIVTAIATAEKANSATAEWEERKELWQAAIASVQKVPSDSQWYAIAQVRWHEYQNNLARIEKSQQEEQKALKKLKAAQEAAKVAQIRQNNAQSIADWHLVSINWETAVAQLREISPQTSIYPETQQLLETYSDRLVLARTHQRQEQSAAKIYQTATEQAKLAASAAMKNQWSTAVSHWRSALIYMQQVKRNTFQYRQAEPLIASYSLELDRATKFQQTDSLLQQICRQESQICNYAIADSAIQLNLTSGYVQRIWESAIAAKASGNWQAQADLLNRIATLEKSLQNISNNTGKRVEVYNADGRLMIVYQAIE
jgi:hypothetical protein